MRSGSILPKARFGFREWVGLFSEGIFLILKVYADESYTPGEKGKPGGPNFVVLAGYVSTQEKWIEFEPRWRKVLNYYKVPHFHLREFSSKKFCATSGNPW